MASPIKTTDIPKKKTVDPNPVRLLLALVLIIFIQFVVCGQFSSRAIRVDILLIAPIYLALTVSLVPAILASWIIGFLMDVISGGFIGFHLFFYVIVTILVALMEQKINLHGIVQQLITLLVAWLFEGFLMQLSAFLRSDNFCQFCIFSKLFVYKTLAVVILGVVILLLLPVVTGYRLRRAAG